MATIIITNITKNAQLLICETNDPKGREYKIDFREGKIYGISGKALQSSSSIANKVPSDLKAQNPLYHALRAFSESNPSDLQYYSIVESLLSYPDLLDTDIQFHYFTYTLKTGYGGKLPKGYVAWLRENNLKFSTQTLEDFKVEQIRRQWSPALFENAQKFCAGTSFNIILATNGDKELCASLLRIVNNSLKRYEFENLTYRIKQIISIMRDYPFLRPSLDDTKNAETAYKILLDAYDKEREKAIIEKEKQILSLNDEVVEDLMIKIPTSLEDFTNEGKQQHNCVGHYYHSSIAAGRTLIYFLRKTNSPDKSYVTCRFDVSANKTVEHRTKNNNWYEDNEKIIERVDNMIKAILES